MKIQSSQYIRMDGVFSESSVHSKHFICSWEWFQLNLGLSAGGHAARPARHVRWQHYQQTTNQVPSASNWPCLALNRALLPQIELLLQIDLTKNRIELLLLWIDLNEPRIKFLFHGTDLTKSRVQISLHRTSLSSLESASPLNRAPLAGAGRRARAGCVYFVLAVFLLLMHGHSKALHHLWDNFLKDIIREKNYNPKYQFT